MIKISILLSALVNYAFIISSSSCSDVFLMSNNTNVYDFASLYSASLHCMDKNTYNFGIINLSSNCKPFFIPSKYNTILDTYEYIKMIQSNLQLNDLPTWYSILCRCRTRVIIGKCYLSLFNEVSYESLPDNCKKLLSGNIEELRSKCDIKSAQKLSVLTAINTSWDDILSSMKTITDGKALSHRYTLTEALFILHLKPSKSCNSNSVLSNLRKLFQKSNEYKDEDVLFYAECITGALACVLKHDKKIPSDFKFDVIQTSDSSWRFMKNAKKLMQAYKDNFIKEQNKMNIINNKNKEENNKKKVYNILQDEEKIKLKQD